MSNSKISALTSATTPLAGTEVLPIVQSSATVKVATNDLTVRNVRAAATTGILQVSGPAAASTRTMTVPDANFTAARTDAAQTFTGTQTFSSDASINGLTVGKGASSISTNTAIGVSALTAVTTASNSVAVGYQAGKADQTGNQVVYVGSQAGAASTAPYNTFVGYAAGQILTTGNQNTFLGRLSGAAVTTGSSHSILGPFQGNSGGLDIRAINNYVVLADGDGNLKNYFSDAGIATMPAYGAGAATFSAAGVISSVSDENWKIKDGVPSNPTEMLGKLQPGYWYYNEEKKEIFGVERQLGFYAQNVNEAIGPEAAPEPSFMKIMGKDGVETTQQKPWGYYDRSVLAVVVMALQEALATVKTLEIRIQTLEEKI